MLPFASDVYAVPEGTSQGIGVGATPSSNVPNAPGSVTNPSDGTTQPVADDVPPVPNPGGNSGGEALGTGGDDDTTYTSTPDGGVQVGDVESTVDDMLDGYDIDKLNPRPNLYAKELKKQITIKIAPLYVK